MRISHTTIKLTDLFDGYVDNDEGGVVGFHGRLIIRPEYQREFVYKPKQQVEVIKTITQYCPVGVFYWAKTDSVDANGKAIYELLDGQQRTLSICKFMNNEFAYDCHYYHNGGPVAEAIDKYEVPVYVFEGSEEEKLEWFNRINIAGEKLTDQELRNAVYHGPFVSSAKKHFSKTGCDAVRFYDTFIDGTPIRQEVLETVFDWKSKIDGFKTINEYMSAHKNDETDADIWDYYRKVMKWAKDNFSPKKGITDKQNWADLYEKFHNKQYNKGVLDAEVKALIEDEDVKKQTGIIPYILSGKSREYENLLDIRGFDKKSIRRKLSLQDNVCAKCGKAITIEEAEGDHITPWREGGKTEDSNLQVLCRTCNRIKGAR